MTALHGNYAGGSGNNGTPGNAGNSSHVDGYNGSIGGNGVYAVNIGGTRIGGGVYLRAGTWTSYGQLRGGAGRSGGNGGQSYEYQRNGNLYYGIGGTGGEGGTGGTSVELSSGTLINDGAVSGGIGGNGVIGGAGDSGVETNATSGNGGAGGMGGIGGTAVELSSGTLTNNSAITGGSGGSGGTGGVGDYRGYVAGRGYGGAGGSGGTGGVGVDLSSGTLSNAGHIIGGTAGNGGIGGSARDGGYYAYNGIGGAGGHGGIGGAGVDLALGSLTNTGLISGGNGGIGTIGGYGVSNYRGYYAGHPGVGGLGGAGVHQTGGAFTNSNTIIGGTGGDGGRAYDYSNVNGGDGGLGGAGVELLSGTLINTGDIIGGGGGTGGEGGSVASGQRPVFGGAGGAGGAGVFLNGGTLTTSGKIFGGASGLGGTSTSGDNLGAPGVSGFAVLCGTVTSTLVVKPGAIFSGLVVANSSANDTLKLSGIESGGTPITLGSQFFSFSTLAFVAGAAWNVDASAGAAPAGGLSITGFTTTDTLDVTNLNPHDVQEGFNSSSHVLTTNSDGTLHFVSGPFSGDAFLFSNDGSGGTDITLVAGSGISSIVTTTVTLGGASHKSPLTISNAGGVTPAIAGANGVVSDISGNTLINNGMVSGAVGSDGETGGDGGIGANFKLAGTFTNTGNITGGAGGTTPSAEAGGAGGGGVSLLAGTLTNSGSIAGGDGGQGAYGRGTPGAGVILNGGTLITSGAISGAVGGGEGLPPLVSDAVQFGSKASTLILESGAVFNGKVVAHASVHDVLELAGTQGGGTAITLGTQFISFSTLQFAPAAAWTVDANVADLTQHPLTLDGFGPKDTLDITNLADNGVTTSFNNDILTISKGATTIHLQFDSAFSGEHFTLTHDGGGTDINLRSGAASVLAASGHDVMNFVGDAHRAVIDDQLTLGAHHADSAFSQHTEPPLVAMAGHSLSANALADGMVHTSSVLR